MTLRFDISEIDHAGLPLSEAPRRNGMLLARGHDAAQGVVVAGQQPGLLTGPLYTFLKAVTAVAAARALGNKVRPVFWMASEDHDVLEVNRVTINGARYVHEYGEIRRGRVPQVGTIDLRDAKDPLLDHLKSALPETEFTPWVLEMVSEADFSNYASAFSSLLRAMFREWNLEVVDPIALRPKTGPVLADLVEKWPRVLEAFERGTREAGSAPLKAPGVFEIVEKNRVARDVLESLAGEIRERPGDFSPNAALRPILQDAVLPVIATVAGPSEMKYLQQIRPIYEVAGVKPSLLLPRISVTFIEPAIRRAAEKAGLKGEALFHARSPDDLPDAGVDEVERKARELLDAVDRVADGDHHRRKKNVANVVQRLVRRVREDQMARVGRSRERLEKIASALMPGGKPQERVENVLSFLNRHGPEFVRQAVGRLDPFSLRHQLVRIIEGKD